MAHRQESVIVVGVDGSIESQAALVFALREGARRGGTVEVVTAWTFDGSDGLLAPRSPEQARQLAERLQGEAVSGALGQVKAPPMLSRRVVESAVGPALRHAARHANYLVVGTTRKNIARRTLLGSVSEHLVRRASVPVLVVPASVGRGEPVQGEQIGKVSARV